MRMVRALKVEVSVVHTPLLRLSSDESGDLASCRPVGGCLLRLQTMAPLLYLPRDLFSAWIVGVVQIDVEQTYFRALYEDVLRIVGDLVPSVNELAQPDIVSLCSNGCAEAMLELGDRYTWGNFQHCVPCDYVQASHWLQQSAMLGNANAHATLAVLCWKGTGVAKDRVAASFHAQESFRLGYVHVSDSELRSSGSRGLVVHTCTVTLQIRTLTPLHP